MEENKKKRVITQNSNEAQKLMSVNDIMAKFSQDTAGLLKTAVGTRKASVYKEHLFAGATDSEKKKLRKKFRNMLFAIANSLVQEKAEANIKQLVKSFDNFYKEVYAVNDYTLTSVCSENMEINKKNVLTKALAIVKKVNEK